MKRIMNVLVMCMLTLSFTIIPVNAVEKDDANSTNISMDNPMMIDVTPRLLGGKWNHTLFASSTGITRLVLSGTVYYEGTKAVSASSATIADFYDGAHSIQILSQSHTMDARTGAHYVVTIGFYYSFDSGPEGMFHKKETYRFSVNPGPYF